MKPRDVLNSGPLLPLKEFTKRLVVEPLRDHLYVRQSVHADDPAEAGDEIRDIRVLRPPERIFLADPAADPFVPIGKYYRQGWCDHPAVYVCEVPDARLHLPSGMVCTRRLRVLADRGMEERLGGYSGYRSRKPKDMRRIEGACATIRYCFSDNFWHWMLDCLPRVHSLDLALPDVALTILMPPRPSSFQSETLRAVLPRRFRVRYDIGDSWVQCRQFYWTSLVSERCMGKLPPEYFTAIRGPIFREYGLPETHRKTRRLYLSRRRAHHRRVINEETMERFLASYGFEVVEMENLPFPEQVRLMHEAEIVLGPHGAGLGGIFFSGEIDVVVLYPTRVPPNYFHSLALGLGQRHHFVCHDEKGEDDSFIADIPALKQILEGKLGLKTETTGGA